MSVVFCVNIIWLRINKMREYKTLAKIIIGAIAFNLIWYYVLYAFAKNAVY